MDMKLVGRFMAAFACTAALAAAGCDNTANRDRSSATAGDATAGTNQPVSLTGCLARGEGSNDFILTKANQPVATSGTAAGAGSVEHKTMEAAARSYRLDGNNDELDKLVGHEIRVSGTLADKGDLNKAGKAGSAVISMWRARRCVTKGECVSPLVSRWASVRAISSGLFGVKIRTSSQLSSVRMPG